MTALTKRWLAAIAIVGFAASFMAVGVSLSRAQEGKAPDLSNLRDAVNAASKRGANVDEVVKALDALEKSLGKGFTPKPGEKPPAELVALREAVETAGRKGEKVDAIRNELDAVEKVLIGKALTPPKPVPPPDPSPRPVRPVPLDPFPFPQIDPPNFGGGGVDRELLEKAQALRAKAFEMMRNNPTDAEAMQLIKEAQELMLKALVNGRGGAMIQPDLLFPNPAIGRVTDRFRLGIRMERLAAVTAEQLGLEGKGVAITSVVPNSPADKAGIRANDIILEFAGKAVTDNPEDLTRQVNAAKAGEKVDIVLLRKGKKVELKGVEIPAAREIPRPELRPVPLPAFPNPFLPDDQKPGQLPGGFPLPNAKPLPGLPTPLDPGRLQLDPDGRENSLSVSNVNGQITIKAMQDGVGYIITGAKGENGLAVEKITITDGDKKPVEVKNVKDVPKEYQPTVEKVLQSVLPPKPRQRD